MYLMKNPSTAAQDGGRLKLFSDGLPVISHAESGWQLRGRPP